MVIRWTRLRNLPQLVLVTFISSSMQFLPEVLYPGLVKVFLIQTNSDCILSSEPPSKFLSAFQLYCSRLSVGFPSYDSRSTLFRLDCRKNWTGVENMKNFRLFRNQFQAHQIGLGLHKSCEKFKSFENPIWVHYLTNFFLQSSCIRVDLLLSESKSTDKRGQYDWRTEKNLDRRLTQKFGSLKTEEI